LSFGAAFTLEAAGINSETIKKVTASPSTLKPSGRKDDRSQWEADRLVEKQLKADCQIFANVHNCSPCCKMIYRSGPDGRDESIWARL
jgi:hypothetical protein